MLPGRSGLDVLRVVRHLTVQHEARRLVESDRGAGSTFAVTLNE